MKNHPDAAALRRRAREAPYTTIVSPVTSRDVVACTYRRDWSPPFAWYHNGVEVDEARACQLVGGPDQEGRYWA